MKIYAPPSKIIEPKLLKGRELNPDYDQECEQFTQKLREFCKETSNHKYAGEVARFLVADGYAEYMIIDGRRVIHLPLGDSYEFPYAERLLISDFIEKVEKERKWKELAAQANRK